MRNAIIAAVAMATITLGTPAKAGSVVFDEFMQMVPPEIFNSAPGGAQKAQEEKEKLKIYFETLESIPVADWKLYPMKDPEHEILLDRMAFQLNDEYEREKVCIEAEYAVRQQGPLAFKRLAITQVLLNLQGTKAPSPEEGPPVIAEMILANHFAALQLRCINEIVND